jgi:prolyl-tRNA synthetase
MNKAGAQEILVPSMQPLELWQKTGRSIDYGPTMFHLEDRHGKGNVLGPTAEEVVTYLAAGEIKSYKQMPVNLYQISSKFRDEFRPRFGAIRSREFIMKDAYSFDARPEGLDKSYKAMYDAYCRIFKRCGLVYVIVEAEVGEMGGSGSHQFTITCESGEDTSFTRKTAPTQQTSNEPPLTRCPGSRAAVISLRRKRCIPQIPAASRRFVPFWEASQRT